MDNTTGGAGWPVLAGFGGLVMTSLALVAWYGPPDPTITALVAVLVLVVVVVVAVGKKAGR